MRHIFPRLPTPFAHSDEVVIYTNSVSTTLTINAADDVVKHYGEAGAGVIAGLTIYNSQVLTNCQFNGTIKEAGVVVENKLIGGCLE